MSLRICKSLYRYYLVLFNSFKDLTWRLRGKGLCTRRSGEEWSRRERWRVHLNKVHMYMYGDDRAYQSVQVVFSFKSYANKTPHTKLGPCILPSSSQVSLTILPSLLPGMSSFELIHEKEQDMLAQTWDPSTEKAKTGRSPRTQS